MSVVGFSDTLIGSLSRNGFTDTISLATLPSRSVQNLFLINTIYHSVLHPGYNLTSRRIQPVRNFLTTLLTVSCARTVVNKCHKWSKCLHVIYTTGWFPCLIDRPFAESLIHVWHTIRGQRHTQIIRKVVLTGQWIIGVLICNMEDESNPLSVILNGFSKAFRVMMGWSLARDHGRFSYNSVNLVKKQQGESANSPRASQNPRFVVWHAQCLKIHQHFLYLLSLAQRSIHLKFK